jgi:tetratricopeptide (TPR) repeat protein
VRAVRRADRLREKRDYADAWDQISQYLNDNPDDTGLLMCAGRIYASAGRSKEAMEYFDKAYQQDSSNIDVLRGVISGAILAHRYSEAQEYLDKAMEADPKNPWFFYLKAQIAQARGLNGQAVDALLQARELNQQQLRGSAGGQEGPTPLTPGAPPVLPPNPFRHSQAVLPAQLRGAAL